MFTFGIQTLKSCCGCLSLRAGCFIVAALQFTALLALNIFVIASNAPVEYLHLIFGNLASLTLISYLAYGTLKEERAHLEKWTNINNAVVVIAAAVCGFCAVGIVTTLVYPSVHQDGSGRVVMLALCSFFGAVTLVCTVVQGIFSWVVHSYVRALRVCENRECVIGENI